VKTRSSLMTVVVGAIAGAAVTVLLLTTGLIPTRTVTKTVVVPQGTSAVSQVSGGTLTPAQIYQKYSRGVVEIVSTFPGSQQGFFSTGPSRALGSGFVISKSGYILTNAHVVNQNGQTVKTVSVTFKGNGSATKRVTGTVVGANNTSDVALIKVDPAKIAGLDPIPLGSSASVPVGETVVAIGNPLGLDFTLTSGIVSATGRDLKSPNGATIHNGIQTDAAINEGNSGGPLIDATGHVIGINEQIASQSGGNQGLGFAVPIDTALTVVHRLAPGMITA
jgi:S1-C subfamily serine protease